MAGEGFRKRKIRTLGKVVTGKTPPTADPENFGGPYPFITIPDLDGRVFIDSTERTISEQGAEILKACKLPAGAVMMSCIATIGKCGITTRPSFTNQQINSVICEEYVDPRYLYYCFTRLEYALEAAGGGGSVYTNVSKSRFAEIEIELPSIFEQRAIACILGALDDKIELNRRMNETLEQIAQAIFKKWFIEPTKNARQKDGGQGLPEGWREDSIYLAADVIYGAPFSSAKFNTKKIGKPLIRIRNLANESPDVFTPEIHPKGYLVKPGDIVVGMDGEFRAYIWGGEKSWLNQRLCVFIPKPGFSAPYVLYSITRPLAEVEATETATTVIHLGKNDIDRFKIIIAPDKILASFNRIAEPLFKRIVLNKQKSRTLAALRDSLLPKLISGELRVPDAEKICARGASALGGMEKCS